MRYTKSSDGFSRSTNIYTSKELNCNRWDMQVPSIKKWTLAKSTTHDVSSNQATAPVKRITRKWYSTLEKKPTKLQIKNFRHNATHPIKTIILQNCKTIAKKWTLHISESDPNITKWENVSVHGECRIPICNYVPFDYDRPITTVGWNSAVWASHEKMDEKQFGPPG